MIRSAELKPGLIAEHKQIVELEHSAPHIGSGQLAVFATPAMVALVERACAQLAQDYVAQGETTVGESLQVAHLAHLAPTPVGQEVTIQAELPIVVGDLLEFEAQIWDESELVGRIGNERVFVDQEGFMRRVEAKEIES